MRVMKFSGRSSRRAGKAKPFPCRCFALHWCIIRTGSGVLPEERQIFMKTENFHIGSTPAVLYGEPSSRVFLYVHGQGGNKEEAARFAAVASPFGYQTLAVDLPGHGGRQDAARFLPWDVIPELTTTLRFAAERYSSLNVRAVSIGAWFSLQAFSGAKIEKCLLSSPLLDMEDMIGGMMAAAGVSEPELRAAGEIPTAGQTLSWRYLCWVREHPTRRLCRETAILYAEGDELIPRATVSAFVTGTDHLTIMSGGEHWLHTPEELVFVTAWEEKELKRK